MIEERRILVHTPMVCRIRGDGMHMSRRIAIELESGTRPTNPLRVEILVASFLSRESKVSIRALPGALGHCTFRDKCNNLCDVGGV